ncbi:hypothetical protein BIU82_00915 [Arthrobacter sp. SW1]|uniref:polysaccharide pyruvyl transferase family protein n=1 Tax=Arthrobacter sp. SW1 TaxID=1920889 RepID=UPI000877DFC3|nr:polysaccharide pyruvyl transferase family protein [Arthrobacter sp. SW1]OFI39656.1 hypothetical protein BIU82_00915 [Arthrobacter sp. SW1]
MTGLSVGLVGFFGWGNFGDELFAAQWKALLGEDRAKPVHDLLAKPYFSRPIDSVLAGFDALVIGGGDLIRTESISQLYWNRAWKSKPLLVSGIGVATESGRNRPDVAGRLRSFLAESSVLSFSVRDAGSRDWIEKHVRPGFEVDVVPDLGFASLHDAGTPEPSDGAPVVGLVLNKGVTARDLEVRSMLLDLEQNGAIRLRHLVLATGTQRRQEVEQLAAAGIPASVTETFDSVPAMAAAVAACDIVISSKFHGLVAGFANGKPCWSLKDTSKARALMMALGRQQEPLDPAGLRHEILSRAGLSESERARIDGFRRAAAAELDKVKGLLAKSMGVGLSG